MATEKNVGIPPLSFGEGLGERPVGVRRLVIFASGNGLNAENIIRYFQDSEKVKVALVVSNNPQAEVLNRAKRLQIPTAIISKTEFNNPDFSLKKYCSAEIDLVVLAGFLLLVPSHFIQQFPDKIINIHPALLPKYGGSGMFGRHVHEAVIANSEKESGISIHFVNEKYDEGKIIFQATCEVNETDTPFSLAQKIHELEMENLPKVIEDILVKG